MNSGCKMFKTPISVGQYQFFSFGIAMVLQIWYDTLYFTVFDEAKLYKENCIVGNFHNNNKA